VRNLEALERAGWDALCAGTGAEFYGSRMTPDGVMVLAHGEALHRDQVVASLEEAPAWTEYSLDDMQVVPLGAEAAALVYRARAVRPGAELDALMTSTYVMQEGDWRLALYQQTVVP
jgi:hypothetical protein